MASSNLSCMSLGIPQRPRALSWALSSDPARAPRVEPGQSLLCHAQWAISLCSANWSELPQAHGRQSYLSKLHIYPLNCFGMAELPEWGCGKHAEPQEIVWICRRAAWLFQDKMMGQSQPCLCPGNRRIMQCDFDLKINTCCLTTETNGGSDGQ